MYEINTDKVIKELKLAVISDLHYGSKTSEKYLKKVLDKVENIRPTHIIMPGDIIDDDKKIRDINTFLSFLKELRKISKVIMSLGNHDISHFENDGWVSQNKYEYFNQIEKLDGVYVLNNEMISDKDHNVNFIGYTEPYENYKYNNKKSLFLSDINDVLNLKLEEDSYNILLAHNPTNFENIKKSEVNILENVDLIISGHMHAGLVPPYIRPIINKNVGIISPNKNFFPKKTTGKFKLEEIDHIIANPYTFLPENTKALRHFNKLYPRMIDEVKIKSR